MRQLFCFLILFISCAPDKDRAFTGSTPADAVVRTFLGIPMADSVDFIRWDLVLKGSQYTLHCNYGIGKPNTNGFYDGGKKVDITGEVKKEKNNLLLQNGDRTLKLAGLNNNLLHILSDNNSLLIGNGGWSYTLNNLTPSATDETSVMANQALLKDSMVFQGRTPCAVPGIIPEGNLCYKLKWLVTLYSDTKNNQPATYKVFGTGYRAEGGRRGSWSIKTGKDGRITYQLNDEKGNPFIYLLKLDENVIIFTDASGKLLVGDLDFSYTLNRV